MLGTVRQKRGQNVLSSISCHSAKLKSISFDFLSMLIAILLVQDVWIVVWAWSVNWWQVIYWEFLLKLNLQILNRIPETKDSWEKASEK